MRVTSAPTSVRGRVGRAAVAPFAGGDDAGTLGGRQEVTVINESGLYTLILRCRDATTPGTLPHRFRKWVAGEVLPTIRKTGGYFSPNWAAPLAHLLLDPVQIKQTVDLIDQTRRLKGRAAAIALWDQFGLGVKPGPDGQAVPTIVGRDYDSPQVAQALAELRRPGVTPLEEAAAYRQLVDAGWRTFDIAAAVGRSHRYLQKRLRLLRLSAELTEAVAKGWLQISVALALSGLPDEEQSIGLQHHFRREVGWSTAHDIRQRASLRRRRSRRQIAEGHGHG